jgi:hypothetical protein
VLLSLGFLFFTALWGALMALNWNLRFWPTLYTYLGLGVHAAAGLVRPAGGGALSYHLYTAVQLSTGQVGVAFTPRGLVDAVCCPRSAASAPPAVRMAGCDAWELAEYATSPVPPAGPWG